jgi:iron-sulfur cluster repair protein YtfE (RIC family)
MRYSLCEKGRVESTLSDGTFGAQYLTEWMAMVVSKENRLRLDQKLATTKVEAALARLSNEDSKLGERLISAAVAGAVVARQPADTILRAEAAEAWNSIKIVIKNHLSSEEEIVLPWMKSQQNFPLDLILRTCEQHVRLRDLARTVDAVSFITGSNEEVTKAGAALTAFAVCLDDLIDGEERDLFPMIQRFFQY